MLWCIARIGYSDKNEAGNMQYTTTDLRMLDSNTLEWKDVPVDSVKTVMLRKQARIGNLVLSKNRKVCTPDLFRAGKEISVDSNGSGLPFIEKAIIGRGSGAVVTNLYSSTDIALIDEKMVLTVYFDGSYKIDTYIKIANNVALDYESVAVCKIRDELKRGSVVEKAEMKSAVIGVACDIINDGRNIVYMGNNGKNVETATVDIHVPNGVTKIASKAIETYEDAILPDTVKEVDDIGITARNLRTNAIIEKGHSALYITSRDKRGSFVIPKFSDNADVMTFVGSSAIQNAIYQDYGRVYEYKDRALSGTQGIVSVALMNSEDITIGVGQFLQCGNLTNILTPNGKIVQVKDYAFCRTVLSNIDLSHCKELGFYLFRTPDECEKTNYWGKRDDLKRAEMKLTFNENVIIHRMALYGSKVAKIDFLGDDIDIERNSLYCGGAGMYVRYKSERVGKLLEVYKRAHPGHIALLQKI